MGPVLEVVHWVWVWEVPIFQYNPSEMHFRMVIFWGLYNGNSLLTVSGHKRSRSQHITLDPYYSHWNTWNISKLGQSGSVRAQTFTKVERLTWNDSNSLSRNIGIGQTVQMWEPKHTDRDTGTTKLLYLPSCYSVDKDILHFWAVL